MKPVMGVVLALLASSLLFTPSAKAWGCTDPLASRVNVGTTKPAGSSAGDGDGQYYIGSDASNPNDYYVCEVPKPTPPPSTPTTSNSSSSANSSAAANSSSSSSANQSQSQKQNQSQTANGGAGGAGGNASATGGAATATGGSVSNSGNSSSKSGVENSGNSSNKNTNTATGGNQSQSSTSSANGNGVGNGNNSDNSSTIINDQRSVASAYAPSMNATAECFKPIAGGGQGLLFGASFGGGKIDENCARLEASRQAPSIIARCKIFLTVKFAKEAGVTMDDCMPQPKLVSVVAAPIISVPVPQPPINLTVSMPPQTIVIQAPPPPSQPSIVEAAKLTHHKARIPCEPTTVPSGKKGCVVTNGTINK